MLSVDTSAIDRFANMFAAAGPKAQAAVRRAAKRTGEQTRTAMRPALVKATGLKPRVIHRALKVVTTGDGFKIVSRGGKIRLKHFGARETLRGVSAAPRGQRQVFAGTFIKGGRFPNRKTLNMGGQVFERLPGVKRWGGPVRLVRSEVTIPEEMVAGEPARVFIATARKVFSQRLSHELSRVLLGYG